MPRLNPRLAPALVVAAALVAGVAISQWVAAARERAAAREIRQALLDELQPVALANCRLARFGSPYDGGYLMCENLIDGLETAYSYGVGPNDDWGCDVSRRYRVPVHQYDCFDPARPVCDGGTFLFHDACIADRPFVRESRVFDTLQNQIAANGDTGRRMIVKMDVEGAEWDSLLATPDEVLDAIDQMPMELHGADGRRFLEGVRKLKRTFFVVNVHFNNWSCNEELEPMPAWAYQVLLVNKRLGQVDGSVEPPAPSSPLNAPDFPDSPDCQAWPSAR